ncbi:MAG: LysM peptidoglycan-binding domain-containing protein [Gracilibacteraceae bacterium]|jgi:hypothetical protein|nr:LysM peptidoglycan-binding domain-containing protein [Gracilibacteraceae bacterium]
MISVMFAVFLLAATAPPWEARVYSFDYVPATVENGDTLWGLTSKHNQGLGTDSLVAMTISYNRLNNSGIQPGQVIYIPVRVRP